MNIQTILAFLLFLIVSLFVPSYSSDYDSESQSLAENPHSLIQQQEKFFKLKLKFKASLRFGKKKKRRRRKRPKRRRRKIRIPRIRRIRVPRPPPPPKLVPRPTAPVRTKFTGASNFVSMEDSNCVICQYLVQRTQSELLANMANGGANPNPTSPTDANKNGGGGTPLSFMEWTEHSHKLQKSAFELARFRATAMIKKQPYTQQEINVMERENKKINGAHDRTFSRADMIQWRPDELRYAPSAPVIAQNRAQEEVFMNNAMSTVYYTIYNICLTHMPPFYKPSCGRTLNLFRGVIQGLWFKDRPENICMNIGICSKSSYLANSPHLIRGAVNPNNPMGS